ncbi:putative lipoprotein [Pseudomonas savastanoi pv. glycinea]|nr:putative lipoprotein [Pseudomonas savastanoi pv. glycinea]
MISFVTCLATSFVKRRPLLAAMALVTLAGCANDPAPIEQMKLTEKAVAQAKAVGAVDDEPEMQMAESKLAQARSDMTNESYKAARMQAEQAELDARLAEARVLTEKSEAQVTQLNTRLNRLRKQLGEGQ